MKTKFWSKKKDDQFRKENNLPNRIKNMNNYPANFNDRELDEKYLEPEDEE